MIELDQGRVFTVLAAARNMANANQAPAYVYIGGDTPGGIWWTTNRGMVPPNALALMEMDATFVDNKVCVRCSRRLPETCNGDYGDHPLCKWEPEEMRDFREGD